MEFKGTPGEWEVKLNKMSNGWCEVVSTLSKNKFHDLATCYTGSNKNDQEEVQANAKLIAAAPLMLKALEKCYTAMKAEGEDLPPELEEAMIDAEYIIDLALK